LAEWQHSTQTSVDPTTWRFVKLHAEQRWDDGTLDTIEVETLQPLDWLKKHRARPGAFVPLPIDLTEMGLPEDMRAKVVAIDPCPAIADGPGHVVTSTLSHLNRFLLDLEIVNGTDQTEKITTTGYHKFYSASRGGWVSACELRPGEQLRGSDGPLTVAAAKRLLGVERVYNFSVEGQHVYHVSGLGVLVHNPDCNGFGSPGFGEQVHQNFPDVLPAQTGTAPGDWTFNTAPGQTGPDAVWTGAAGGTNPGFNYAELKPNTPSGVNTFYGQLQNWELPPGETQLWGYNPNGIIGSSGINY
jgi:hypothetical protein